MKKNKSAKKEKYSKPNSSTTTEEDFVLPPTKDESLWRPLYPFESKYMTIKGFAYHYIDERPESWKESPTNSDESASENSEDAQTSESENDGVSENGGDERPTLLFVHGNPTWTFYWRNLIAAFRQKYRVIAVDHIGCGLSEKPSVDLYPYSLERRVSDLAFLVKKLNLTNVVLVAHDWGVAVGMGAAIRYPKRFSKIVLMNGGAYLSNLCPLRIRICRIPILNRLLLQRLNVFPLAALKSATAFPAQMTPEIRAGYLAPYDSYKNRVAVCQFVQDIPLSEKHRTYQTMKSIEEGLSIFSEKPVALIWGMKDFCFTPEFLKRFLHFFPEAEVSRIEKAGHYVVEDAKDEVISIIDRFVG